MSVQIVAIVFVSLAAVDACAPYTPKTKPCPAITDLALATCTAANVGTCSAATISETAVTCAEEGLAVYASAMIKGQKTASIGKAPLTCVEGEWKTGDNVAIFMGEKDYTAQAACIKKK